MSSVIESLSLLWRVCSKNASVTVLTAVKVWLLARSIEGAIKGGDMVAAATVSSFSTTLKRKRTKSPAHRHPYSSPPLLYPLPLVWSQGWRYWSHQTKHERLLYQSKSSSSNQLEAVVVQGPAHLQRLVQRISATLPSALVYEASAMFPTERVCTSFEKLVQNNSCSPSINLTKSTFLSAWSKISGAW